MSSSSSSSSGSSSPTSPTYPGPDLPFILPEDYHDGSRPSSSRAFLSKAPAQGTSIDLNTHQHEYQILAKLPGFNWDSITLATQKRRVLHIVADKWDNNGGGVYLSVHVQSGPTNENRPWQLELLAYSSPQFFFLSICELKKSLKSNLHASYFCRPL